MVKATRAKNTPVTCSHTTLENRTTGVISELFACLPAAFTVCASGMRRAASGILVPDGVTTWFVGLGGLSGVGFGVLTASAACISVFAACRVPYPNARPSFTRSITLVYVPVPLHSSQNESQTPDITSSCEGHTKKNENDLLGGRSSLRRGSRRHDLEPSTR